MKEGTPKAHDLKEITDIHWSPNIGRGPDSDTIT